MLPAFQPIAVSRRPHPFDDSQWLFELKYDGFRALAYLDNGRCRSVSRNGHAFASFAELASSIARQADATTAVFDGEIVCVDGKGRPRFNDLLFRRRDPIFFAFDLLCLNVCAMVPPMKPAQSQSLGVILHRLKPSTTL